MQFTIRLILILIANIIVLAQVGTWEKIPTLTGIRELQALEDEVIIASDGGLMVFDKSSGLFSNGIQGKITENLDLNTTFIDSDSLLWIGSRSPGRIVEVMDLHTHNFEKVEFVDLDAVNSFVQVGDSVYATYQEGLEGGLLLYRKDSKSIKYLDLFNNFSTQSSINMDFIGDIGRANGNLYFRTNHEIIWIELDGRNLKDPANWNVAALPSGSSTISSILKYSNNLHIAAGKTIYTYNFQTFRQIFTTSNNIVDMQKDTSHTDAIILATSGGLSSLDVETSVETELIAMSDIQSIGVYQDEIWVASGTDFLDLYQNQHYERFTANRPVDHLFNRIIFDDLGQLVGGAKHGLSIYTSDGWRNIVAGDYHSEFNLDTYDWDQMIVDTLEFQGNAAVEDMISDDDGNLFISLQGRGVLKLDDQQPGETRYFSALDGSLEPTFDSDTYVLPGQLSIDSKQNVWVPTKFVREGGAVLSILTPEDSVFQITQYQGGLNSRSVKSIAIDKKDRVWLGSQVRTELQAGGGIHFLEVIGDGPATDMELNVSFLSTDSPLASNEILQLAIDTHNILWILTPAGVQSMPVPDKWLTSSELKNYATLNMTSISDFYYYWQLTDYNVTGMEIDERGNHWFLSSNAGVHVLQDNGRWINGGYGYNTGNSGILENEIYCAAFDSETGQTYLATPKGISVLNTPFAKPKENYSNIHIYPQPFNPDIHDKVIIQGLMDNSSVKILTIQGVLVKELTYLNDDVQGNEAQWDARDEAGDKVGSGVYILYLYNDDGEVSSQKLAVLR